MKRMLPVMAVFVLVFAAINFYIGWQGRVFLASIGGARFAAVYWIVFWLLALSYVFARLGSRYLHASLAEPLKLAGSLWMAVFLYALILIPLGDLAAWLLGFASISTKASVPVIGAVVILLIAALLGIGSWNARNPIVRTYTFTIPKKAGSLKQLRIAMASDLHLGSIVRKKHLAELARRMNELKPDLVVLPGDIIDDEIDSYLSQGMTETMKIIRAPLGVYAVSGNHDYYGGDIDALERELSAAGIEMLLDRSVKIADSFYLAGRKDKTAESNAFGGGRLAVGELVKGLDPSLPLILMDHQPYGFAAAEAAGVDLLLSGHTHRGQMAPNHWITRRMYELDWGYLLKGRMHAVVSSGYGTWGPPIRLGSRSEIIELVVHFDEGGREHA